MKSVISNCLNNVQTFSLSATLFAALGGFVLGQQNVTLNGTSGSESSSGNLSTNGGLNISLEFLAEYLVVAGGGSGGTPGGGSGGQNTWGAGGGGAGGMRTDNITLSGTSYGVTVGAGGSAPSYSAGSATRGVNGGNSTFGDITALGGGGGAGGENDGFGGVGAIGGSGGGGGSKYSNTGGNGTSGQGYGGGSARNGDTSSAGNRTAGGGGGGAGAVGGTPASGSSVAGNGGAGLVSSISGAFVTYAGGGGGGARDTFGGQAGGSGGAGGGGAGSTTSAATSGTDGLGGGGGGAGADSKGGDGGDGIVIVRYKGSVAGTGGTVTSGTGSADGYTLHTFTTTGSSSLNLTALDMNARLGTSISGTISGNGGLTFNGPGNLKLSASNTFTGDTRVGSGTLTLNHSNALANSTLNMSSNDNGTVAFGLAGDQTYNIGAIGGSRNLSIGGNTLSVGGNDSTSYYDGVISGNGSLTKTGVGYLTLGGINTYTGVTTVSGGLLDVEGSLGNTAVTVANAELVGSGSIGGAVTLNGYGVLSAYMASFEMGTLSMNAGSYFVNEIDSLAPESIGSGLVVVNGDLNIANEGVSLVLNDIFASGSWANDTKFTMINYTGAWNGGIFALNGIENLYDDSNFIAHGQTWRINYNDTTGGTNYSSEQTLSNFVTLTAVPEPTVVTLGGFGALLLLRRRRA